MMQENFRSGFLSEFFEAEGKKLALRKQSLKLLNSQNSDEKSETYGNVLYSFCLYRGRLRDFRVK